LQIISKFSKKTHLYGGLGKCCWKKCAKRKISNKWQWTRFTWNENKNKQENLNWKN